MPDLTGSRNTTAATTLSLSTRARHRLTGRLLVPEDVITSPETRLRYRIDSLLGEGGFGQAFLATRIGRSRSGKAGSGR